MRPHRAGNPFTRPSEFQARTCNTFGQRASRLSSSAFRASDGVTFSFTSWSGILLSLCGRLQATSPGRYAYGETIAATVRPFPVGGSARHTSSGRFSSRNWLIRSLMANASSSELEASNGRAGALRPGSGHRQAPSLNLYELA